MLYGGLVERPALSSQQVVGDHCRLKVVSCPLPTGDLFFGDLATPSVSGLSTTTWVQILDLLPVF